MDKKNKYFGEVNVKTNRSDGVKKRRQAAQQEKLLFTKFIVQGESGNV